jgi:hypothetical protein
VALISSSASYQLNTSTRRVRRVRIQADKGNSTALVSVGGSAATSVPTNGTQQGVVLAAGDILELTSVKPSEIYLTGSGNSIAASFLFEND